MEPTPQITPNGVIDARRLKALAAHLGFTACGIAPATPVDDTTADTLRHWIAEGHNGTMHYMANHTHLRLDPTQLLPAARSIIAVALNYYPQQQLTPTQYQFAYYAYGTDYHDAVKNRLRTLAAHLHPDFTPTTSTPNAHTPATPTTHTDTPPYLICCDTKPLLERHWAWRAGLGWTGKNTNLIIPNAGSYFFLGEIITTLPADHYDTPLPSRCGTCDHCLRACPTGALCRPHHLDARRCLSYLTIEHRGDIPPHLHTALGTTIYGCDRCQQACPHNRSARPTTIPEFTPSPQFLAMQPADWQHLTPDTYRQLFRHSAVKRAKYDGLMRNIACATPPSAT